jgi:hypothetical protein
MRGFSSGQIEFPLMPGTDNLTVFYGAFGQRATAMRAHIIQRQWSSLQRSHAQSVTLNGEFLCLGFDWKILPTAQSDPLTHPRATSLHGFDAAGGRADSIRAFSLWV